VSQSALASIVLPVFCLIGLGYLYGQLNAKNAEIAVQAERLQDVPELEATVDRLRGILGEEVGDALADFVFTIAIPMLLFRAIGTLAVPQIDPWPFWLAYFGAAAVNVAPGALIIQGLFGRDGRAGVIAGMSAAYGNIVMVGMPVVTQAFGEAGLVTILLLIAVHLPVMMTVSAVMIEVVEARAEGGGRADISAALLRVGKSLVRNPLILGILAGVAFRLTGAPLEGIARTVVDRMSDTAIPLALVSLGMSLHKYGVRGNVLPAIAIGAVKLAVLPVVALILARHVFALPPLAVAVAVVSAACPTGANAYLIASRFKTGLALSANAITLTTAASVLSMGVWLSFLVGG